jgi:hypothetical protein
VSTPYLHIVYIVFDIHKATHERTVCYSLFLQLTCFRVYNLVFTSSTTVIHIVKRKSATCLRVTQTLPATCWQSSRLCVCKHSATHPQVLYNLSAPCLNLAHNKRATYRQNVDTMLATCLHHANNMFALADNLSSPFCTSSIHCLEPVYAAL